MSSRPSARWLAPAALAVAFLAVIVLAFGSLGDDDPAPSGGGAATTEERTDTSTSTSTSQEEAADGEPGADTDAERPSTDEDDASSETEEETYTVQAGDTLSAIAGETGVPIEELEELNPGVDSQSLSVGQELKLTE